MATAHAPFQETEQGVIANWPKKHLTGFIFCNSLVFIYRRLLPPVAQKMSHYYKYSTVPFQALKANNLEDEKMVGSSLDALMA